MFGRKELLAASLLSLLATHAAHAAEKPDAAEQRVRAAVKRLAPTGEIDTVASSVVPGFHEVVIGRDVVYVSNDGRYVFAGPLLDVERGSDLTEVRKAAIRKDVFAEFEPGERVTFEATPEKHRVLVFTDIDCGYCRRMHADIAEYTARGITVEYLFYPRSGPSTAAFEQAVAVTCAKDRGAAFTSALRGEPVPPAQCESPVARSFDAAIAIGANGTPSAYLPDGRYVGGYLTPDQLVARLDALEARP